MGWPTAREGHGHGVWIVLVEVTTHQGAPESGVQGEARQVLGGVKREVSEMESAKTG